jgi:hypothetical protein
MVRTLPQTCSLCGTTTTAPLYAARINCSGCPSLLIGGYIAGTAMQVELQTLEAVRWRALADAARTFSQ